MVKISKNETSGVQDHLLSFHDGECGGLLQSLAMLVFILILPLAGTYVLTERPSRSTDQQTIEVIERTKLDVKN